MKKPDEKVEGRCLGTCRKLFVTHTLLKSPTFPRATAIGPDFPTSLSRFFAGAGSNRKRLSKMNTTRAGESGTRYGIPACSGV